MFNILRIKKQQQNRNSNVVKTFDVNLHGRPTSFLGTSEIQPEVPHEITTKKKKSKDVTEDVKRHSKRKLKNKSKNESEPKQEVKQENIERNLPKGKSILPKLILKRSSSNYYTVITQYDKLDRGVVVEQSDAESTTTDQESVSSKYSSSLEYAQDLNNVPSKRRYSNYDSLDESDSQLSESEPTSSSERKGHSNKKNRKCAPSTFAREVTPQPNSSSSSSGNSPLPFSTSDMRKLPTPYYYDEYGCMVWVCPACGGPDNCSAMICCDDCDSWYHWACVGITEEPHINDDWYCDACLIRQTAANKECASNLNSDHCNATLRK